jgi:hypothetical protein
MKLAKNFVAVTLLMFAFSGISFGGDQQTPGGPTPPPPPPTNVTTTADNDTGEVTVIVNGTPIVVSEETAENLWYEALLGLLSIY